jgi:hypothetical protein
MGKTRPVHRDARLPEPASSGRPAPALTEEGQAQVRELRDSGRWLILHANFFNDDDASYFEAMEKFRAGLRAGEPARGRAHEARAGRGREGRKIGRLIRKVL